MEQLERYESDLIPQGPDRKKCKAGAFKLPHLSVLVIVKGDIVGSTPTCSTRLVVPCFVTVAKCQEVGVGFGPMKHDPTRFQTRDTNRDRDKLG